MPTPTSPATSRRWLAESLRKLRESRGVAQKDAARECGWSGARLSYLETGHRSVAEKDLDRLLPYYGVPEADREPYYDAVRNAQADAWWERYEHLVGDWVPTFLGLEQGAAEIRTYEPLLVPGILQTAGYVRAIMRSGLRQRSPREIERLVELRTARQAILTRPTAPTQLDVVVDESVLLRSTDDPGVLAGQLEHMATMAALPNVTLRVVPLRHGVHSFSTGPFAILSFPQDQPDPLVYLEHRNGDLWLEDFGSIERYELAFQGLVGMALSPDDSLATVQALTERQ